MLSGGEISGTIFNSMPGGSQLILYGGLSGHPLGNIDSMDLIFNRKTISGFNLGDWKTAIGQERFLEIAVELQDLILNGVINTRIQGVFSLDAIQEGLTRYIRNMSEGKVLFAF